MTIEKKLENGTLTLAVAGRLDTNTAPELEGEMTFDGVSRVVFDLSGLEYISSAGLRILMAAQKAMNASGGAMKVTGPNASVSSVFEMTGLDTVFDIS